MKRIIILLAFLGVIRTLAASFQNLGFEDADLSSVLGGLERGGLGPADKLLPGWALLRSGQPVSQIFLGSPPEFYVGPQIIDDRNTRPAYNGRLGLVLQEQVSGPPDRYELSQLAQVPAWATEVNHAFRLLPFQVRINGEALAVKRTQELSLQPSTPLALTTIDVSRFAGQDVTLSFETIGGLFAEFGTHEIYDITFTGPNRLTIGRCPQSGGAPARVTLGFAVEAGHDYIVEFRDSFDPSSVWQPLPGAPHNSGLVIDPVSGPQRFYRLRSIAKQL